MAWLLLYAEPACKPICPGPSGRGPGLPGPGYSRGSCRSVSFNLVCLVQPAPVYPCFVLPSAVALMWICVIRQSADILTVHIRSPGRVFAAGLGLVMKT